MGAGVTAVQAVHWYLGDSQVWLDPADTPCAPGTREPRPRAERWVWSWGRLAPKLRCLCACRLQAKKREKGPARGGEQSLDQAALDEMTAAQQAEFQRQNAEWVLRCGGGGLVVFLLAQISGLLGASAPKTPGALVCCLQSRRGLGQREGKGSGEGERCCPGLCVVHLLVGQPPVRRVRCSALRPRPCGAVRPCLASALGTYGQPHQHPASACAAYTRAGVPRWRTGLPACATLAWASPTRPCCARRAGVSVCVSRERKAKRRAAGFEEDEDRSAGLDSVLGFCCLRPGCPAHERCKEPRFEVKGGCRVERGGAREAARASEGQPRMA